MARTEDGARARRWTARIVVWSAFAATVWFHGPKAADALAVKFAGADLQSPAVDLDRVGLAQRPSWLCDALLLAVATELQPCFAGTVAILDEVAAQALQEALAHVPWVRETTLERAFPDKLVVRVVLRRPVLAVRDAAGAPLGLCSGDAVALPWVEDAGLPELVLTANGGPGTLRFRAGERIADARVAAAAAVAVEWRDEVAPLVAGCPPLVAIDPSNLGERLLRSPRWPEIRVKLRRADGAAVVCGYDRPPDSVRPRVPAADKADVLRAILTAYPGLHGLVAADLRFPVRWADWLLPREAGRIDPVAPWASLPEPR